MQTDDFCRVREKLIKKIIDDQRTAVASCNEMTAKVETAADEQLEGRSEESATGSVTANDAVNSSALSLKIVNVRSCSGEETDGSWSYGVQSPLCTDDQLIVKQEQLDSSLGVVYVGDNVNEDVTTTNYITIAPTDVVNNNDITASECRRDDETQHQYSDDTDSQPASTVCDRQVGQVLYVYGMIDSVR